MFVPSLPRGRKVLLVDFLVGLWALAWIWVGFQVNDAVEALAVLPEAYAGVGREISDVGRALGGVEVPLIGDPLQAPADAIEGTGRDITAGGSQGQAEVARASDLLGTVVALIPTLPLLLLYGPPRAARALETGALRRSVRAGAGDPEFERFLAERAAMRLDHRRLRRVSREPWRDLADGRTRALAAEELRAVGLSPRRLGPAPPAA